MKRYTLRPGTERIVVDEVEQPQPQSGEVLVKIRAVSLNYRDLLIARGAYSTLNASGPIVPLSDCAGEVVAVGGDIGQWRVGDRVCGTFCQSWLSGQRAESDSGNELGGSAPGVLTEYRCFGETGLVRIPEHLSYEESATLPCAGVTAWNALFGSRPVSAGETVLLIGTGGVSTFSLQLALSAGAEVIAVSSSDEKLERYSQLGMSQGINYRDCPDWGAEVKRRTNGRGADHIVEVGGTGTLPQSLQAVAMGGQIHLVGVLSQGDVNLMPLIRLGASVRGIMVGSRKMFQNLNIRLADASIRPIIQQVFDFENASGAYAALAAGGHLGKIVIRV